MNRRRFLGVSGLGALAAFFAQIPSAVASTVESCVAVLEQIREIALGSGNPNEKLAQIVALIDGEIGPAATPLAGDFAGTIPAGEVWKITGDVNLTGDLIVEGTLESVDTFTLEGNGFQILVQNGGVLNLAGKSKTAWVNWGDPVVGWSVGDTLVVAPNVPGVDVEAYTTWSGDWSTTSRPAVSPDYVLRDGRVMRPEVANISQTAHIENVTRVMFHSSPGVQTIRNLTVNNAGVGGMLDFYPIHFHFAVDSVRGSLLDSVVVSNGKKHAFVPHGSHGITFRDCVGINIADSAFWWNTPSSSGWTPADNSNDIVYDRCAVIGNTYGQGFRLPGGERNVMRNCVAAACGKLDHTSGAGVHWRNGSGVWDFSNFTTHNNFKFGSSVWQNQSHEAHPIHGITAWHNPDGDYDHGAYGNLYHYRNIFGDKFIMHAKSEEGDGLYLTIEDSDLIELELVKHQLGRWKEAKVINTSIDLVRYAETSHPSWMQFIDCGLTPGEFVFDIIRPDSVIEIIEAGTVVHKYEANAWTS